MQEKNITNRRKRHGSRYTIQINIELEVFDYNGKLEAKEQSVTENISHNGACVFTSLKVGRGRFVKMTSLESKTSTMAIVRSRRKGKDSIVRLHLEFIDFEWPIEGID